MIDIPHTLALVAVAAIVTFLLRFMPMMAVRAVANNPYVLALGKLLPGGIMVILVDYSIQHGNFDTVPTTVVLALSLVITIGLYIWRKNALLCMLAGVAVYGVMTFG